MSLSLGVVSVLLVVTVIFEAPVFSRSVPLLGPVVVAVVVAVVVVAAVVVAAVVAGGGGGAGVVGVPLSGSGPAAAGASYADSPDVSRLPKPAVAVLVLLFPVPWLREFGPEAVRRQAPLAAATAGSTPGPTGPRAPRLPAAAVGT